MEVEAEAAVIKIESRASRKVVAAKMAEIIKTTDYKKFVINGNEVPFSTLDRCLPNDKVVYASGKWSMVVRGKQPPLVGILDCLNKTRYGFTAKNVPIYLFHPMNKAYPPFRVGSTIDPTQNYLSVIQYETWELGQSMPRGSLVQTLGPVGDFEAEASALYWLYSPWTGYTKKTSEFKPSEIDVTDRVEIRSDRGWQTFNVDPDGCLDIDDCFSYLWDEYGQTVQCAITIADVAEIIDEGSPVDLIARKAGQSLYQDSKKPRHMLPATIAEDYASLSAGDLRPGITLFFDYNKQTNFIDNIHFKETLITNQKQYTYESIKETHHTDLLKMLYKKLTPTSNSATEEDDPHNWIAALMIFYNTEFAYYINHTSGGLLRAHKEADRQKQQMLEAIDPDLKFLAMSSAVYIPATAKETRHHGLNTDVYTHASSPLRRYADLHNQRIFKELYYSTHNRPEDPELLETLNQKAKDAKKYERDYGFLQAIFETNSKVISGKVIGLKQKNTIVRIEMWIPAWKRILKISLAGNLVSDTAAEVLSRDEKSAHTILLAQSLELAFSYDSTKCHWKERMIFRII